MTRSELVNYGRSIAYFSGFGGLEIKSILFDIDDSVVFVVGAWTGSPELHKSRIKYGADGEPYFTFKRAHIPLAECIRM